MGGELRRCVQATQVPILRPAFETGSLAIVRTSVPGKQTHQRLPLIETVTPADEAELAQKVAEAAHRTVPVYPIGGATMLGFGAAADRPGIGLSLARLNRVVDYPADDLTITVQAGLTVAELARRLARRGQRLPVDVPMADRATVGGTVAVNLAGPRRLRWGTLRDHVIGLRAVDGRGQVFSAGGRVVKNAAGYNLCRLLTGSLGTLAVITELTFTVRPMAEATAWVACSVGEFDDADRLLERLVRTHTLPVAVELVAGPAWSGMGDASGPSVAELVVGFEGTAAEVAWMVEQLHEEWSGVAERSLRVIRDRHARRLWDALIEFPWTASGHPRGGRVLIEVRVRPSQVLETVEALLQLDPGASIQAHAGDGVLRAELALGPEEARAMVTERLRPRVAAGGGSVVVLDHPGQAWDRSAVWGPPPEGFRAMEAIKRQLDPQGIFNPDRFVFSGP